MRADKQRSENLSRMTGKGSLNFSFLQVAAVPDTGIKYGDTRISSINSLTYRFNFVPDDIRILVFVIDAQFDC